MHNVVPIHIIQPLCLVSVPLSEMPSNLRLLVSSHCEFGCWHLTYTNLHRRHSQPLSMSKANCNWCGGIPKGVPTLCLLPLLLSATHQLCSPNSCIIMFLLRWFSFCLLTLFHFKTIFISLMGEHPSLLLSTMGDGSNSVHHPARKFTRYHVGYNDYSNFGSDLPQEDGG